MTNSVSLWDGQTVVLGGLVAPHISKFKDEVPVLGDIPLIGRLFRNEASQTNRTQIIVMVTPTVIDPAGNRCHTEGDMPFVETGFPAEPAPTPSPPNSPVKPNTP